VTIDRRAIREDGERLLDAARARGRVPLVTTWLALLWDFVFFGIARDVAEVNRRRLRVIGPIRKWATSWAVSRLAARRLRKPAEKSAFWLSKRRGITQSLRLETEREVNG